MILPEGRDAVYRQLASHLRDRIAAGEFRAGRLPSEQDLMAEYGLGRHTVRRALGVLQADGVIIVQHGSPTRVREESAAETVRVLPGSTLRFRWPSAAERREFGLAVGSTLAVLTDATGREWLYPGERTTFTFPEA